MILKVSSTISSDTEDDFNSSTEAKGGGAIGLRNAASGTPASESLTKDLSAAASTDSGLSSQKSSISSTDSDTTRSKYEASSNSEKNSSNDNVTDVILKKVFKPRLSKNAEQIEALLRRINEENKKTKEVLDNLSQSGEVISKAPAVPKNHFNKRLVDPQDLISDEEDQKTKDLVNAVIPPIRKPIIEKTSTTFLGTTLKKK